jgi:hypothetical protein
MPRPLFREAVATVGDGLNAIKAMADLCEMSLTSTAIRYTRLVDEPVAIVVSLDRKVLFSIMSPALRLQRNLTWLKKGVPVPPSTLTSQFASDNSNIQYARSASGCTTLNDWFDGPETEISEEVIGLREYGRTLTVLHAESLPDPEDVMTRSDDREDDEVESLLPSQRFFQKSRYLLCPSNDNVPNLLRLSLSSNVCGRASRDVTAAAAYHSRTVSMPTRVT